jgi:hypothetical protein
MRHGVTMEGVLSVNDESAVMMGRLQGLLSGQLMLYCNNRRDNALAVPLASEVTMRYMLW